MVTLRVIEKSPDSYCWWEARRGWAVPGTSYAFGNSMSEGRTGDGGKQRSGKYLVLLRQIAAIVRD